MLSSQITTDLPGGSSPTSVQFVCCDSGQAVVSHSDGKILIYDLETGQIPAMLADSDDCRLLLQN